MGKIKFSMAFHCYQPVFNFGSEFDYAYEKAYLPLLGMFEKYPEIKASFHYPGNMLQWFQEKHPDYICKLKALIERNQIEIIGGCFYEPVMAMIPDNDRKGQIKKNSALIREIFGIRPRGAWITERIWEPELTETLISEDIEYTILDDNHLLNAGKDRKNMFRPWNIREKTGELTIFPADKNLRYAMPFNPPETVIAYMRELVKDSGKDKCLFFADDGEKFGAWPNTYRLVYEKKWLDRFFSLLSGQSGFIETHTYSEVMDTVNANRLSNLPTASYGEMMEWSGGNFNNFFKKYPEAGRMHKRMVYVSEMLRKKNKTDAPESAFQKAETELYKAQSGCAYWHGIFGGIYLPHLRSGVYNHLIKAKDAIKGDKSSGRITSIEYKTDGGDSETIMENNVFDIYLTSSGGGISELDYKPHAVNLVNSMSRKEEAYHKKANWSYFQRMIRARRAIARGETANIHDALGVGERGLKRFLYYDDYARHFFITHVFNKNIFLEKLYTGLSGNKSFLKGKYALGLEADRDSITATFSKRDVIIPEKGVKQDIEVEKRIILNTGSSVDFSHTVTQHDASGGNLKYAVEFNMLVWDKKRSGRILSEKRDSLILKDRYSGLIIKMFFDKKREIVTYPVYTVNETEKGLKKTFQGISVAIGGEVQEEGAGFGDQISMKMEIA